MMTLVSGSTLLTFYVETKKWKEQMWTLIVADYIGTITSHIYRMTDPRQDF